jgi:hypothetical protein
MDLKTSQRLHGLVGLIALALLVGGCYQAYSGLTFEPQADTEVQATVVESHLDGQGFDSTTRQEGYSLVVRYRYEYEGATYESTNFRPGLDQMFYEQRDTAEEKLGEYEEGTTVTAYVDPENPQNARLLGARSDRILSGVFVAVIGFLAVFLSIPGYILRSETPKPDETSPGKYELREQFLDAFGEIESYPIEEIDRIRNGTLDGTRTFESHDCSFDVMHLNYIARSDPETPCENAEELTEFLITEMEEQGYFFE